MSSPGFRSFSPALQRFFAATVVNMVGSGMLFAFVFIYLDDVRGLSGRDAGLAVGMSPLATVACTPFAGWLSDRFGARRIVTIGCLLSIVAGTSYMFVTTFAGALATGGLLGVANGLWFPSQAALLAIIIPAPLRPASSAFQRTAINIGAGVGGAIGGFLVDVRDVGSFQRLMAVNVLTYVVFLACLPGLPSARVDQHATQAAHGGPQLSGYRSVLRDRFYLWLLLSDVGVSAGFGFLFGVTPAYAKRIGLDESAIGVLFMIGAAAVVVLQLPMLRWVRGRRRMRSLALMNVVFLIAFLVTATTTDVPPWRAAVLIGVAQTIGGFGEAILGAVRQPLTADLAPPALAGRYFGLSAMVFQGLMGVANAIGGTLLDHSLGAIWIVAGALSVFGAASSLLLERRIPEHAKRSP